MTVNGNDTAAPNYVSIGKGMYLHGGQGVPDPKHPTVVLIFGWMGARLPHLYKYSGVYDKIYPGATKIIIRCQPSLFWTRESTRRANLVPVVEVLEALGCIPSLKRDPPTLASIEPRAPLVPPRILVHAFSNGGAYHLETLSRLLEARAQTLNPTAGPETHAQTQRALSAIIFDSCPGRARLPETRRAFGGLIRNRLLRVLAHIFLTLLHYASALTRRLLRMTNMADALRAHMNRARLLPWMDARSPRLYMYSEQDEMVRWGDVEDHAAEGARHGLRVRLERFADSPHVAHARTDPARYWGAVGRTWEDACEVEG